MMNLTVIISKEWGGHGMVHMITSHSGRQRGQDNAGFINLHPFFPPIFSKIIRRGINSFFIFVSQKGSTYLDIVFVVIYSEDFIELESVHLIARNK